MNYLTHLFIGKWKRCVLGDKARLGVAPQPRLVTFGLLLVLLGIWDLTTRNGFIDPIFLPSPEATLNSLITLLTPDFLWQHLLPSIMRITAGFLLSVLIAFPLGILAGQIPSIAKVVHPVCGAARYLPVAALVPICILWFGIFDGQKIAVIVIGVVFQLVLLIAGNTASVPNELIETGLTLGLSRSQMLLRIVIPWSMPSIWEDLRIAAGWAWSYLVLAELVAGNRGVGYFIVQSQRFLETANAFAGIILIGILGLLTDLAFRHLAIRLFRWP